jgi:hypothetical protein
MMVEGLTSIPSRFGPKETMDRLEAEITARGMTVFARVDHAAGGGGSWFAAATNRAADLRQR